jgi:hypothetical protein
MLCGEQGGCTSPPPPPPSLHDDAAQQKQQQPAGEGGGALDLDGRTSACTGSTAPAAAVTALAATPALVTPRRVALSRENYALAEALGVAREDAEHQREMQQLLRERLAEEHIRRELSDKQLSDERSAHIGEVKRLAASRLEARSIMAGTREMLAAVVSQPQPAGGDDGGGGGGGGDGGGQDVGAGAVGAVGAGTTPPASGSSDSITHRLVQVAVERQVAVRLSELEASYAARLRGAEAEVKELRAREDQAEVEWLRMQVTDIQAAGSRRGGVIW